MRKRESIVEIFSTFLQFEDDFNSRWLVDKKLQKNIQRCINESSYKDVSQHYWAIYWHKIWLKESTLISLSHLSAYLQEIIYWTAKKMINFSKDQSVADLFQIAISKTPGVLEKYDSRQGVYLEKYASFVFRSIIKDELRKQREIDICTDWGLLHKLSGKNLLESLQYQGIKLEIINEYLLIWQCFKAIYAPKNAKTSRLAFEPEAKIWQDICQLYNKQTKNKHQQPEQIKNILLTCAKLARNYLYPKKVSIDEQKPGQEKLTLLDEIPATIQESVLTEIIAEEDEKNRQRDLNQINQVLLKVLIKLDVSAQRLLKMYYGQGLSQQEIAQELEIKQYTVSRRLSRYRESLLTTLGQWTQETLHYSLDPNLLKRINAILEEWLKMYYANSNN